MKIVGKVKFRSSEGSGIGPPGEKEILELNPWREKEILEVTGWDRLEPGSLNLRVEQQIVENLLKLNPVHTEDALKIKYPEQYKNIPNKREEYYYYNGTCEKNGCEIPILVRRAKVPVRGIIELFAPVKIKKVFKLKEEDEVVVFLY